MPAFHEQVNQALPRLTADNYRITSPATWGYNCIAWAVGATDAWWWPAPGRYWPPAALREESVVAFLAVFTAFGYVPAWPRAKSALNAWMELNEHGDAATE
jgi:hypothetical protein